jgi:hypothetical protein
VIPQGARVTRKRGPWIVLLALLVALVAIVLGILEFPLDIRTDFDQSAKRAVWCVIDEDDFDDVKRRVRSFASSNDLHFVDSSRKIRRGNGVKIRALNMEVQSDGFSILITSFVPVDDPVQERYRVGIAIYCRAPCVDWEARGNEFIDAIVPITDGTGIVERSVAARRPPGFSSEGL